MADLPAPWRREPRTRRLFLAARAACDSRAKPLPSSSSCFFTCSLQAESGSSAILRFIFCLASSSSLSPSHFSTFTFTEKRVSTMAVPKMPISIIWFCSRSRDMSQSTRGRRGPCPPPPLARGPTVPSRPRLVTLRRPGAPSQGLPCAAPHSRASAGQAEQLPRGCRRMRPARLAAGARRRRRPGPQLPPDAGRHRGRPAATSWRPP
mmetsp:Transcript_82134/g.255024  ORF Transcript_82134/g.255024 Transcript_82134/m.255024 type:complete len:207 (-) Transcript_82134:28-648(-)